MIGKTIFLKYRTQDVVEKLFPDPSRKSKFSISLDQYYKVLCNLFLFYTKFSYQVY